MIIQSTFSEGTEQADGRKYVKEVHTADDGQTYEYEWLSDGIISPQVVMEERAVVINRILNEREQARLMVAGTSVPLTHFEFLSRFTGEERVRVRARAKIDDTVDDYMKMMELASNIVLPLARPGLQYLAYLGDLSPERAEEIGED